MARTRRRRRTGRGGDPVPTREARIRPPLARGLALALPVLAVLVILHPYLWPPHHAPTSIFSDIHHQHAPMLELLSEGLRADGELPRWNRFDFGGMPTLGDPQAGTYNPAYWVLALAPGVRAFGLLVVAHALAGALGFVLYARALGLGPLAATAGALAFTLGGKLLLHLVLPGHTVFAPFYLVPLLLWVLHGLAAAPSPGRLAAGAVLTAMVALGLHPQVLFYTALLVLAVALVQLAAAARPARALARYGVVATLGAGLAAVHLLPIVALAPEFSRGQPAFFDPARDAATDPPLGADWLATTLTAAAPGAGVGFDWEAHYFLGGVTCLLVLVGLVAWPRGDPRRRLAWSFGALALALLLYGLGPAGGLEPWLRELPGFRVFRLPARAFVPLGLPIALVAALGVEALVTGPFPRRRTVLAAAWIGTGALVVAAGGGARVLLPLGAAGLGAALLGGRPEARPSAPGAATGTAGIAHAIGAAILVAALALETGRVVAPSVRTAPETALRRPAPGVVLPADLGRGRFVEFVRSVTEPGVPELVARDLRLETLAGFNPLIPWRFVLYASYAAGFEPFAYRFDVAVPLLAREEPSLFDLLGVTDGLYSPDDEHPAWRWEEYARVLPRAFLVPNPVIVPEGGGETLVDGEIAALNRLAALDPRQTVLLHGAAAAPALAAAGIDGGTPLAPFRPLSLDTRAAHRITLTAELARPGIVVLTDPYFPGWHATDGERSWQVLRANVLFRALALPAGRHRLTLEFAPRAWRIGWWISALALGGTLVLAARGGREAARRLSRRRTPSRSRP